MHVWDGDKQPILHDPTAPKTGGTIVILPLRVRKRKGGVFRLVGVYNEGSWAVVRRGVFNWRYVSSVLHLMRVFR